MSRAVIRSSVRAQGARTVLLAAPGRGAVEGAGGPAGTLRSGVLCPAGRYLARPAGACPPGVVLGGQHTEIVVPHRQPGLDALSAARLEGVASTNGSRQ